jgi:hypothetical protein
MYTSPKLSVPPYQTTNALNMLQVYELYKIVYNNLVCK